MLQQQQQLLQPSRQQNKLRSLRIATIEGGLRVAFFTARPRAVGKKFSLPTTRLELLFYFYDRSHGNDLAMGFLNMTVFRHSGVG
ncbi:MULTISPECIES: hypothetical protein [unclassified Rhizobium]|jgi:hypothetical protein|uniref:hypothetical protein n=1 Tax=unclassified Rhizobium TaxID=2613769 RepID=UPI000FEF1967|nr:MULTISPECIES: hypothetical protein [unclassified Rhizobium]MBN8951880.1 hypothetical protein [Rhizobium tropici]RKD61829.1 hypothetical protein BJ928_107433 [Rhizobium sp. WW_1]